MSGCTDPRLGELLDARVLGACTPEESAAVDAHVAACPYCAHRLPGLRAARQALMADVSPVAPGPELKQRVMSQVRDEARLFGELRPAERPARSARRRRLELALGAAAALAVAGTLGVVAGSGLDDPEPRPRVITAALTPEAGRRASARLIVGEDTSRLVVRDLRPAGEGRVYQVWLVRGDGAPRPSGTLFRVRPAGETAVPVPADLTAAEQLLVSEEPAGGSAKPTSDPLLAVDL
jgi:anti-sigma-K factor RskA